ncbi:MAG: DUF2971 domain-containing protein [Gammaproteobacteria bacterium]|nr:DUF2971 domain-containing protein [Gammaproteobacteria bacterium]
MNDPCLRVTPSHCLNDPFEFGYTESDIKNMDSRYSDALLGSELEAYSKLHGIISLTTSNTNIQMWSHYSDSHQGAVIELFVDDNAPESLFINNTGPDSPPFRYQDFLFDKVKYRKTRKFSDDINDRNIEAIKKHYYFAKAKQWKKEKEYRFIIPLTWINKIIFNEKGLKVAKEILNSYHCCPVNFHIKFI